MGKFAKPCFGRPNGPLCSACRRLTNIFLALYRLAAPAVKDFEQKARIFGEGIKPCGRLAKKSLPNGEKRHKTFTSHLKHDKIIAVLI
jgi:hypothetical protein